MHVRDCNRREALGFPAVIIIFTLSSFIICYSEGTVMTTKFIVKRHVLADKIPLIAAAALM